MNPLARIAAGLLVMLLATGCTSSEPGTPGPSGPALATNEVVTAPATVRFNPIEGGCWSLEVEGRGHYQPLSLPQVYRQDGTAVTVVIRGAQGYAGFCPHPHVHLDSIAPR